MVNFILFKFVQLLVLFLPLRAGYWLAERLADIRYLLFKKDRLAVRNNLKVVLGGGDKALDKYARSVFRNFGKYLVDFFRFSKVDRDFIRKFIKIENIKYLDEGLSCGKGVVIVTAHLGNWELGGAVAAMLGYPINIIVWTHESKLVNDLFVKQRTMKGVKIIPVGAGVRRTFRCLANNEAVAIVGDIDFAHPEQGIEMDFFGRRALIPKGPALFSLKTGAPIVPIFMVREADDTFSFIVEQPITYNAAGNKENDMKELTGKFLRVLEYYIRKYPSQWFMGRELWK